MRLTLAEWAEREFSDAARPHPVTLREMAADGDVPGARKVRGRWYVFDEPAAVVDINKALRDLAGDDPVMKRAMGL